MTVINWVLLLLVDELLVAAEPPAGPFAQCGPCIGNAVLRDARIAHPSFVGQRLKSSRRADRGSYCASRNISQLCQWECWRNGRIGSIHRIEDRRPACGRGHRHFHGWVRAAISEGHR